MGLELCHLTCEQQCFQGTPSKSITCTAQFPLLMTPCDASGIAVVSAQQVKVTQKEVCSGTRESVHTMPGPTCVMCLHEEGSKAQSHTNEVLPYRLHLPKLQH